MAAGAATVLVLLMLVVLVDVLGRNLFNRPLASGTELTEMLMAVLAFLSFPLLAYRQRDITVDLVDMLAGDRLKKLQVALAGSVGAGVFGLLSWQLVTFARRSMLSGEATPQLHVPLAWAWWFMSAMAAFTALAALVVAVSVFTRHPVEAIRPSKID
jgi:TRAP-type C4-dicarboxylate transport system permease small subunit